MIWTSAVTLTNARVVTGEGTAESVRFASRVLAIGDPPRRGDAVVDVRGSFVLPGLVNAHDHLELNHYGRMKFRDRYGNASEWIGDMRPRLADDAAIRKAGSHPLSDRLFVGALKNVLSGVTTVAHHNPFYSELRRDMPLRVLRKYGWAHSFLLQDRAAGARGERGGDVQRRFRSTPASAPFFVHVAEGVDAAASGELERLESLGCLAPNTVLVHGVGIDAGGWRRVASARAGAVWCPASNMFLFGRTIDPSRTETNVAIGTDSRLTGSRDLLEELCVAYETSSVPPAHLLAMVTVMACFPQAAWLPRRGDRRHGPEPGDQARRARGGDQGGASREVGAAHRRERGEVHVGHEHRGAEPDVAEQEAAEGRVPQRGPDRAQAGRNGRLGVAAPGDRRHARAERRPGSSPTCSPTRERAGRRRRGRRPRPAGCRRQCAPPSRPGYAPCARGSPGRS